MNDYIIEFENLNHLMENQNMKLPDKVLAFKLLDGTKISKNQRQMYFTLVHDLIFNSMKTARKRKNIDNNVVGKARLVAKGFEEIFNEEILKYSILALIAQEKWKLNTIDIKNAFCAMRRN